MPVGKQVAKNSYWIVIFSFMAVCMEVLFAFYAWWINQFTNCLISDLHLH